MKASRSLPFSKYLFAASLLVAVVVPTQLGAQNDTDESPTEGRYGYYRLVEGGGTVFARQSGSNSQIETNFPILTGDRILVERGSRANALLPDDTVIAVDETTDLVLDRIADSPDDSANQTVLRLLAGRLLLDSVATIDLLPIVDTDNARLFVSERGVVLIEAAKRDATFVTVRSGYVEVLTRAGSSLARAGEEIVVSGPNGYAEVRRALPATSLELWAEEVERTAAPAAWTDYAEPADPGRAGLGAHGEWVEVDRVKAWRPRVSVDWRPYTLGSWAYTPAGYYWVSRDPWSPYVYQYGNWDYSPGYGWVWFPGRHWAPSHVTWYWGPSYIGWVPSGYYDRFYRHHGNGVRFGIYGWAGGWDGFVDWTFCPVNFFRNRRPDHHFSRGRDHRDGFLERGIVTTDTREILPQHVGRPDLVQLALERGWRRQERVTDNTPLPEVTDFVSRRENLPEATRRSVASRGGRDLGPTSTVGSGRGTERRTDVTNREGRVAREVVSERPRSSAGDVRARVVTPRTGVDRGNNDSPATVGGRSTNPRVSAPTTLRRHGEGNTEGSAEPSRRTQPQAPAGGSSPSTSVVRRSTSTRVPLTSRPTGPGTTTGQSTESGGRTAVVPRSRTRPAPSASPESSPNSRRATPTQPPTRRSAVDSYSRPSGRTTRSAPVASSPPARSTPSVRSPSTAPKSTTRGSVGTAPSRNTSRSSAPAKSASTVKNAPSPPPSAGSSPKAKSSSASSRRSHSSRPARPPGTF